MPTYDKSTIDEIARLRDFAINELKYGSFDSSAEEVINIEGIDRNTIWEISERAYKYTDKFFYSRLDASPREPHFFDFFLKELLKITEFENLVYEASFSNKLISVKEEIETCHLEQMESVGERHEEEIEFIEQRHNAEIEELEKFEIWLENKEFTSSQIKSLTSAFELREKGLLEVSDLLRILYKIVNLKSD